LFVEHVLSVLEQSGFLFACFDLELVRRDLAGTLLISGGHALLASLSGAPLLLDLLVKHFLGEFLFFFGNDFGGAFDSFELAMRNDDGVSLLAFLGLFSDLSEFS
jgi:hypothetical protein